MSINDIQEQLIREFAPLNDWMDKYEYLIAHGMQMPAMEERYKTEEYAVRGCQSRLWIASEMVDGKVVFHADSNSKIVRGMLALVLEVLNRQPPEQVVRTDLYFLNAIGLAQHLSPVRANGLSTIVRRVYQLAGHHVNGAG